MKTFFIVVYSLLFSILLFPTKSIAQFNYKVEGTVKQNEKGLGGAVVSIYNANDEKIKDITTNASGAFSFGLKPDEEYTFNITKPGYITLKLVYSTIGLSEKESKDFKGVSNPEIQLFELPSDPKLATRITDLLTKPMMSFYYNADDKKIVSDEDNSQSMQEELAALKKIADEPKTKELQAAELESKYKNALMKADNALISKNYSVAKDAYNEALSLKSAEQYPKTKLAEVEKLLTEKAEKEKAEMATRDKLAKEKADADAAEKDRIAKEKAIADAAAKEKLEKEKAIADAAAKEKAEAAEKERLAKEKAAADAAEKDKIAKEKIAAENAEKDRIAKEKAAAEAAEKEKQATEKAIADAAEKERLEKERLAKEKVAAEAAQKEKAEKEKAIAEAAEKEKAAKEKATADAAEQDRLAKIAAEKQAFEKKYSMIISKGDSAITAKNYTEAKKAYNDALALKPADDYPKNKLNEIEVLIANDALFKNDLAKKYPPGVTEEIVKEKGATITNRIVVIGNKGYLYSKKETSFGAIYYFKDGVTITEQEFKKETEIK